MTKLNCFFLSGSGVLGIKVKIMLPHDPKGMMGPRNPLPDHIHIVEPKDEVLETFYSVFFYFVFVYFVDKNFSGSRCDTLQRA